MKYKKSEDGSKLTVRLISEIDLMNVNNIEHKKVIEKL